MTPRVVILSSPSGGGKTTLARTLVARRPDVGISVSATTRAPRPGERQGEAYHFVSRAEFRRRQHAGDFLEWAEYAGELYGTSSAEYTAVQNAWAGINVGDEYMGRNVRFGHWRDTHVEVTGPIVQAIQLTFVEDWHWATGHVPELNWAPQPDDDASRRDNQRAERARADEHEPERLVVREHPVGAGRLALGVRVDAGAPQPHVEVRPWMRFPAHGDAQPFGVLGHVDGVLTEARRVGRRRVEDGVVELGRGPGERAGAAGLGRDRVGRAGMQAVGVRWDRRAEGELRAERQGLSASEPDRTLTGASIRGQVGASSGLTSGFCRLPTPAEP